MSSTYCVHAASVGKAAMSASRGTIDAALREAKFLLSSGHDFVWVDDGKGNVVLSADEVRARLDSSSGKYGRRREPKAAYRVRGAMSLFDDYLDMAGRSVGYGSQTADERFRFFLIDLAATRCDLAREFLDDAATGLDVPAETAKMAAELETFDPQAAPSLEGLEPRMIAGLKRRIIH
jgi:hypothetical protein